MKHKLICAALAACLSATASAQANQAAADERQQAIADSLRLDSLQNVEMDEVTVVSQRQLVKNDIDKLTYDVQADPDSKSKTLMEMLRKVPMVTVDGQDNVKIKGSSSFKIYRNGHRDPSFEGQNLATILKTLPANTIKKIEVITDPGAKEDAEGSAYILNIVMLDNARFGGVAGSLSAGVNMVTGMTYESAYLTTKVGKLTLTANYNFADIPSRSQDNEQMSDYLYNNGQRMQSSSRQTGLTLGAHMPNLSASYEIDSLDLITLSAGGQAITPFSLNKWRVPSHTSLTDANGQTVYAYDTDGNIAAFQQNNVYGRLDYQHKTHLDGETLTLSYMLSGNGSEQNIVNVFSNMQGAGVGYNGYTQYSKSRFMEHTFQVDYIRPLGQWHKLEFGGKYIDRSSKSDTRLEYDGASDNDLSTRVKSTTRVGAAYAEWLFNKDKWSARAGMRYEFSRLGMNYLDGSGTDFHRNLNDWVPSMSVKYAFNDNNSLKLSLATSISRPGIGYLNPTRVETPTSISYGNIDLKSSRRTNITLDYTHIGSKFTWNVSPFIGWTRNGIGEVNFLENDKQVSTYNGVLHSVSAGATSYAQWSLWKGGQLSYNGGVCRNYQSNHPLGYALGAWSGWYNVDFSQKLPWKLHLSCGAGGDIGRNVSSIYGYSDHWNYHWLSLQRSFLKEDRLTIQFAADNLIGPRHKNYDSRVVQGDYTGFSRYTDLHRKQASLRITWRFGKLKASVKSVDRSIENSDLKNSGGGGVSIGGK